MLSQLHDVDLPSLWNAEQAASLPALLFMTIGWTSFAPALLHSPLLFLPGGGPGPRFHGGLLPGPPTLPLRGWMRRVCGPGQAWTLGGWWWRHRRARGGPCQSSGRGPGLPSTGDQLQGPGADQGRTWERHNHFLWPAARKWEPGLLCRSWHGK